MRWLPVLDAVVVGDQGNARPIPPHRVAERVGHDGSGLLDLSVLSGEAASHRASTPVTTLWRFGRLILAFRFISVRDAPSVHGDLDSDPGGDDDDCSGQDNTAHGQYDS
jgi:hypothetical protein